MKKAFLLIIFIFTVLTGVYSDQVRNGEWGYYLNPPRGWSVVDDRPDAIAFADPSGTAVIQVFSFPAEAFEGSSGIAEYVVSQLNAEGDQAEFSYNGSTGVFADLTFDAGLPARGMFFFFEAPGGDYAVQTFTGADNLEDYADFMFSALDSFSPGDEGMTAPGPLAQFLRSPGEREILEGTITLRGSELPFTYPAEDLQLSREVIDREARILTEYDPRKTPEEDWKAAWKRYYRMVYRNSYSRLKPAADIIRSYFGAHETPREEIPAILLTWLQGFEFVQSGGISDLESPLSSLINRRGDCDSLALTFLILLDHLGIDGALFVSMEYGHAIAGVDIPGEGARIEAGGTDYLVAELTDDVRLGLIDQTMADPAGWIGITFYPY